MCMDPDGSFMIGVIHPLTMADQLLSGSWQTDLVQGDEGVLSGPADSLTKTVFFAMIPVVVAFSFIVFILYRARREAYFREKETAFKLDISELELKVLRTQINPHFIFNCLNSIHHFMHRNNLPAASEYLIKFSRLIRYVLETSYDRMIPLADEVGALRLYMELEQLRTNGSFTFQIEVDKGIDPDAVYVPPLLIQPFVENAIWHGLSPQVKAGVITVSIEMTGEMLRCTIRDNGRPSESKEPYDLAHFVKRNSRGMSLIQSRLDMINRLYKTNSGFTLERPAMEDGTRVTLTLPYED